MGNLILFLGTIFLLADPYDLNAFSWVCSLVVTIVTGAIQTAREMIPRPVAAYSVHTRNGATIEKVVFNDGRIWYQIDGKTWHSGTPIPGTRAAKEE